MGCWFVFKENLEIIGLIFIIFFVLTYKHWAEIKAVQIIYFVGLIIFLMLILIKASLNQEEE